jgi:hypothetical protein
VAGARGHVRRHGRPGRLRARPEPRLRGPRRLLEGRREHRRRPQGDVRLRGQGRAPARPPPRGDRRRRARPYSSTAPTRPGRGLVRPHPTSATSARRPGRYDSTTSWASRRSQRPTPSSTSSHRPSPPTSTPRSGSRRSDLATQLARDEAWPPRVPRTPIARTSHPQRGPVCRDRPAGRRTRSGCSRCKRPELHRRHRRRPAAHRRPLCDLRRRTSPACRRASGPRHRLRRRAPARAGLDYYGRTTFEFARRALDRDPERGGRRAAATTAWPSSSAGPPTPGHRLRAAASSASSSPATPRALPGPVLRRRRVRRRRGRAARRRATSPPSCAGRGRRRPRLRRPLDEGADEAGRPLGAPLALLVGEAEAASGTVTVRAWRQAGARSPSAGTRVVAEVRSALAPGAGP